MTFSYELLTFIVHANRTVTIQYVIKIIKFHKTALPKYCILINKVSIKIAFQ